MTRVEPSKYEDESHSNNIQTKPATTIFYYTGTGNSLWAARVLARELGSTQLISMVDDDITNKTIDSSVIGLIFPVHMWGVPRRVLNFIDNLKALSPDYIFAIANNAGQVSNTLVQLQKVMDAKGIPLSAGWSIIMPSNYIPWGGPGSLEEQNELFQAAQQKLATISAKILNKEKMLVEKGPLWQRIVFTGIYKLAFPNVPKMDEKFWTDERCNQCSICVNVCPNHNIEIEDSKLIWHNRCEQCLACLQWCPREAMQYGRKTPAYARYQHPEVIIKDLMK